MVFLDWYLFKYVSFFGSVKLSYALRFHSVLGVILHGAAFVCTYAGTGPECIQVIEGSLKIKQHCPNHNNIKPPKIKKDV